MTFEISIYKLHVKILFNALLFDNLKIIEQFFFHFGKFRIQFIHRVFFIISYFIMDQKYPLILIAAFWKPTWNIAGLTLQVGVR